MLFTYKYWNKFCKELFESHLISIPAKDVDKRLDSFLVLKHDVETNVRKAYRLAKIESKYGHCGSYYVQAYLIDNKKNLFFLEKIKEMGHEVSYHYDVLDYAHGNLEIAKQEFKKNMLAFQKKGFEIHTVCQHGNPLIEREGYTSNRDFFRNSEVQMEYPNICDIMVNFKAAKGVDYLYFSDAGRKFKQIFDPLFNDVVNSDYKDIPYDNLSKLIDVIKKESKCIVSTHPHRWCASKLACWFQFLLFKTLKKIAKALYKLPFMKKIISKHYNLAKKI